EACHAALSDFLDDRNEVGSTRPCLGLCSLPAGPTSLVGNDRASEAPKLLPSLLGRLQRCLSPLRDHLALCLGNHSQQSDNHFIRLWHIGGNEANAGLLQAEKEGSIT